MDSIPDNLKDQYLICPYDAHHHIRRNRMPIHLQKCAKQHPDINLVMCPYNSIHRHKACMAKEHEESCPDRLLLNAAPVEHKLPEGLLSIPAEPLAAIDDSTKLFWDDEETLGNTLVSIRENAQGTNVYLTQNLTGSKAEKKLKKAEERIRFLQTKEARLSPESIKKSNKSAEQTEKTVKKEENLSKEIDKQSTNLNQPSVQINPHPALSRNGASIQK